MVAALFVSQHNATANGWKNARAFLEFVQKHNVPHVRIGKTVLVDAEDLRAALRALRTSESEPIAVVRLEAEETADDVLARLGMRRAG